MPRSMRCGADSTRSVPVRSPSTARSANAGTPPPSTCTRWGSSPATWTAATSPGGRPRPPGPATSASWSRQLREHPLHFVERVAGGGRLLRVLDAVRQTTGDQPEPGLLEGVDRCAQLGDHVPALPTLGQHPLHGDDLAPGTAEPLAQVGDYVIGQFHWLPPVRVPPRVPSLGDPVVPRPGATAPGGRPDGHAVVGRWSLRSTSSSSS